MTWLQFVQAVALTLLFVMGSIFKPLREHGPKLWQDLVSCPLCLGFWVGLWTRVHAGHLWQVNVPARAFAPVLLDVVLWGALVGVVATAIYRGLELMDAKRHEADLRTKELEDGA